MNWPALWLSYSEREARSWIFTPLMLLLIAFPIGVFTGGMQQLNFLLCPNVACQTTGGFVYHAQECNEGDMLVDT